MPKRLAFVVNNAGFFVSHRLPIADAATERGYNVSLITGQPGSEQLEGPAVAQLTLRKIPHFRTWFRSAGLNPLVELTGFLQTLRHVWRIKPSIIHTASPKGGLYGGMAARILRVPALVIAVSGMGYLFTGEVRGVKRILRFVYSSLMRFVCSHPNKVIIVQNSSDFRHIIASRWATEDEICLIPGSGVDLARFCQVHPDRLARNVILPARLLSDKGVREFVEAARILKSAGCIWNFVLVGTADYSNPTAIGLAELQTWISEGAIEWWGHCEDMPAVYAKAGIVCLPSHREGMPKCLLEAAAAGCAVVTTDEPGCREAIIAGKTGDLVPVRDSQALAAALGSLIKDVDRRYRYGAAARELALSHFGIERVVGQTIAIYERLLQRDTQ